jgi:hypothetical protein
LHYCCRGGLSSCEKEKFETLKTGTPVTINYSIKRENNLKSAQQLSVASASLTVENSSLETTSYESDEVTATNITFSIPDGDYKILDLIVYDSLQRKILYFDREDEELVCDNGDCGEIELSVIREAIPFDWETATFVCNDNSLPVLPWLSGSSTGVSRYIALDHKKADGWVMLHHTFKMITENIEPWKYMLMYNKYTGILRMWYWHEGTSAYSSLKYAIQHLANTSIQNFNTEFALPMDMRLPYYSEYYSGDDNIPASQGLTKNTWYLFEYEFAYDNNVSLISVDKSDLLVSARGINIEKIQLEGIQTGKIDGKVAISAPGANLFNIKEIDFSKNTINNSSGANSKATTTNSIDWWEKVKDKVSDAIINQIGNVGGSLASSILNLAATPATKFLNSLIHQGLENRGSVNLSINTKIELKGTLTEQQPVSNINLHIPGITAETGLHYLYNAPLGVFNITTTPIVNYLQTYFHKATWTPKYFQYYAIDRNSFEFEINPEILDEITIIEKKTELYFYKRYGGGIKLEKQVALNNVEVCAQNKLTFETKYTSPNGTVLAEIPHDEGYEYYKFAESAIPPTATTSFGLCWDGKYINPSFFSYFPVLEPDRRFVVKTILRFKVNSTGREVTHIKSYLPEYVYKQTLNMEY